MGRIVFITGTDTGVGKTVLTGLLVAYLRGTGLRALAMKPFCSGSRDDARLLFELNNREIPIQAVNPFYFRMPLAPLVAARLARRNVSLQEALTKIRYLQKKCEVLLVEGVGGVLVPLGETFMVRDLITRLRCPVLLTAWNQIGVLNHVLLSTTAIVGQGKVDLAVVLMEKPDADTSAQSNPTVLRELLPRNEVLRVPFLRGDLRCVDMVRRQAKICEEYLRRLVKVVLPAELIHPVVDK